MVKCGNILSSSGIRDNFWSRFISSRISDPCQFRYWIPRHSKPCIPPYYYSTNTQKS